MCCDLSKRLKVPGFIKTHVTQWSHCYKWLNGEKSHLFRDLRILLEEEILLSFNQCFWNDNRLLSRLHIRSSNPASGMAFPLDLSFHSHQPRGNMECWYFREIIHPNWITGWTFSMASNLESSFSSVQRSDIICQKFGNVRIQKKR